MIPSALFNHLGSYDNWILTIQSHYLIKHSHGEKEGKKKSMRSINRESFSMILVLG